MRLISVFFLVLIALAQSVTTYNGGTYTNPPFFVAWNRAVYDKVAQQVIVGGTTDNAGIYSNGFWGWKNHVMTQLYTTGVASNTCNNSATVPENRHTYAQHVIDTKRNRTYFWRGACGGPPGPSPGSDMWYIPLFSNPLLDNAPVLVTLATAHGTCGFSAASFYDEDDDVIFAFCNGGVFAGEVYCVTTDNPTPGTPTAKQLAAGCVLADDWNTITATGGIYPTTFGDLKGGQYDTIDKVACFFGGYAPGPGAAGNETWCYTVPTKTWVNRAPSGPPPAPTTQAGGIVSVPFDWNPNDNNFYFAAGGATPGIWAYNYPANTWTQVCSCGEANPVAMAVNANTNTLVIQAYAGPGDMRITEVQLALNTLSINLTIREAIYSGGSSGIARSAEPFCQGVPIPQSAALTGTGTLGLTGASAGQFRVLSTWDGTNIQWLEVCGIVPSLTAGGTTTVTLNNSGSGNFGGSDLITDGSTITVSTNGGACGSGTAYCFEVKKANHSGIDRVRIGATEVVASGASDGFVLTGPDPTGVYPANVSCTSSCTTLYKSKNDATSTCDIERNGPVRGTLKCYGSHKDASGNEYMKFTARYDFYQGKPYVKVDSLLRNADYGTSNTFATAYKGHQGYELRMVPNISGTFTYTIAGDSTQCTSGICTGTMTTANDLILYQGESLRGKWQDWCGYGCVSYTPDQGYYIKKDATTLASGDSSKFVGGWSDIRNNAGVGVEIGVNQLSEYWPKSLEFNQGTDVRIGIWARENSIPYYQAWPQYSWHTLFLNFHATALASPENDFLKFQHYLVGSAAVSDYNNAGVFPFTMPTAASEDAYYTSVGSTASPAISAGNACCITDLAVPYATRYYAWAAGGGGNQAEFRWSDLQAFIKRGMTGRYLNSAQFYRMEVEKTFPRADGFTWRSKSSGEVSQTEGFPNATSANVALAFTDYVQFEHEHWYGLTDYYYMTGDEIIKDALLDGPKNFFLETRSSLNNGAQYNSRSVGSHLMGAARMAKFLASIGDSTSSNTVFSIQDTNTWTKNVNNALCESGFPSMCTQPTTGGGISMERGNHYIQGTDNQCLNSTSTSSNTVGTGSKTFTTQAGLAYYAGQDVTISAFSGVMRGTITSYSGTTLIVNSTSTVGSGTFTSWNIDASDAADHIFMLGILNFGLLEYRAAHGPTWNGYTRALDLAYGVSQWMLNEGYEDNASPTVWTNNGFRYNVQLNTTNNCSAGEFTPGAAEQTVWAPFYILNLVDGGITWERKFKFALQQLMSASGLGASDMGAYQLGTVINTVNNPGGKTLVNVTISGFTDNMDGTYKLDWTTPAATDYLRIKYSDGRTIVDWIGFDPVTNTFTGDPATEQNWFSATEAPSIPIAVPGPQTITINTGIMGMTSTDFSVKAMSGAPPLPVPGITVRGFSFSGIRVQ